MRIKGLNKYIQHLQVEESNLANLAASKRCVHPLSGAHSWNSCHQKAFIFNLPFLLGGGSIPDSGELQDLIRSCGRRIYPHHDGPQREATIAYSCNLLANFFLGVKSPWKLKNSIKGWRIRPASVIFYIQTQNGIHNEIIWNNSALQQHYIWMKTNIKKLTILNIYWLWNLPSSFSLRLLPGWWPYYRPNSKAHRQDHM